jgi:hypothetical protein
MRQLHSYLCCWHLAQHLVSARTSYTEGSILPAGPRPAPDQTLPFVFFCLLPQVDNMTNKHAVFMTRDGRISLAGLSSSKVDYLADAMVDSIRNH